MTVPPPPDDALAALRAEYDRLLDALAHASLSGGIGDEGRHALKRDIADLLRTVERRLAGLTQLKDEVRALVPAWKQLPVASPPDAGRVPTPVAAPTVEPVPDAAPIDAAPVPAMRARVPVAEHTSVRVDHLGASTFVAKGWTAISTGDYPRAEETLVRALDLAPDDPEAGALLGWALMHQDRLDEARDVTLRVLARSPDFALARVDLGYIALREGRFADAIEQLAAAVRDDVDRKAALYATHYLGLVYLHRGMHDDAVLFFRRALALGPNLVEAYFEMGRAHWMADERDAAREAWRAGAGSGKFNPWSARCAAVLEQVEQGGDPPPLT